MKTLIRFFRHHLRSIAALLIVIAVAWMMYAYTQGNPVFALPSNGNYPEVQELAGKTSYAFQDYSDYFRKLADAKGGAYAYQVLLRAEINPGTDIHLLGHVIGDILYKQQGLKGIYVCTQDFRNACSHSIVIGELQEHGVGALPDIATTCRAAPGGKGAYTMCFHGLGHGVLAFNNYDFQKAVAMCKLTGTPEYQDREYIECVGGATMEMIAGVHDPVSWKAQYDNYFKDSDPLSPCDLPFMPKEVQPICYVQLTPHLFTSAGMDLGNADPSTYPKAFSFCSKIPATDIENRSSCYGGFGKEFTVIAQGRDVRDIGDMQAPALTDVRSWCAAAHDAQGESDCDAYALSSLFWGGENNPNASLTFCSLATGSLQDQCYQQLAGSINFYLGGAASQSALCGKLPEQYQGMCTGTGAPS